jgi:hypothetical protein
MADAMADAIMIGRKHGLNPAQSVAVWLNVTGARMEFDRQLNRVMELTSASDVEGKSHG